MTWNMIKVDCNVDLWKKEIKIKGSLDFGNQGLFMKNIFDVFVICMFFVFWIIRLKTKLSEQENNSVGTLWRRWITTKTINLS